MEIRWFGTACLTMQHNGHTILFDPFIPLESEKKKNFPVDEFRSIDSIVITHGHFDHLVDVPFFTGLSNAVIYCSQVSANTLRQKRVDPDRIRIINRGDRIHIGDFDISVLSGRHIVFDWPLKARTLFSPRVLFNLNNAVKILKLSKEYVEGRTFIYDITVNGTRILHLGSLNIDDQEIYPSNVDIMTVPFQGRSDIDRYAAGIIKKVNPRSIYLHHFDDAFPPISSYIDPLMLIRQLTAERSEANVIVPDYFVPSIF